MLIQGPPVEILDRFWMLGSDPYPLYLFRGSTSGTLFEGGTGAMGPVLRGQLESLALGSDYVRQAVITHAHPDHVMAIPLYREMFPSVSFIASATAAETLGVEKALAMFGKLDDMLTQSLLKAGVVAEPHARGDVEAPQFAIDRVVQEGDRIDVDEDTAFEVLETPGHSPCSLSFHEPQRRVLIISDATGYFMPEHGQWWPNYFADYGAYIRSIERLAGLGAEVLCLSHNAVIRGADDVADYFRGALDATQRYHERILAEAQAGKSVREIAEALGVEIHDLTPLLPLDFFQKNCGLLVKQSLAHAGGSGE
jgi:glyoxylase-like metal-dependent hydrolase (beta-lactamase superfamily II)